MLLLAADSKGSAEFGVFAAVTAQVVFFLRMAVAVDANHFFEWRWSRWHC